jgi:hypothetical protein
MSASPTLAIVHDPTDPLVSTVPVQWALTELYVSATTRRLAARIVEHMPAGTEDIVVLVAGGRSPVAQAALQAGGSVLPTAPEAFALVPATVHERSTLLAAGSDVRGLVYAVLELADRIRYAADPASALGQLLRAAPVVEQPVNRVRGILRTFASDIEDLGWYHDRQFWRHYLTMLATQRYNRLHLAFGIGFDFARHMRDSYLYFAYPFLLSVPGYTVQAAGISPAERERNLTTLQFIAREAKRRGLHFQLGLWAQVYAFEASPDVNHPITGLTPANHAAYCRDAVRALLQAVPDIDGLTLRVHGESGIAEGSYDFWRTFLRGIADCGRQVAIDLHAKGLDQQQLDLALATGQPVTVSPKFWAEHLGLPYHQTDIRAVEQPGEATGQHARLMALSAGTRRFTRYGYADFLAEDRPYTVISRIWPGTQRLLLWGDPETGRAYGRAFTFCGMDGVELFEPLSFSGRRGSGLPDGRNPYQEGALQPEGSHRDWEKYAYTYRLWGQLLYNPNAAAEQWQRYLRVEFGAAAPALAAALAQSSRILPLITTAHHPSAANNRYWPELYTNMPLVWIGDQTETGGHPYRDTASPRRFGNVSALDPEVFASIEEYVAETLTGTRSGRYSPLDVARWLADLARAALAALDEAALFAAPPPTAAYRRWTLDVRITAALGQFFAQKLRAGVGYTLYTETGDITALRTAVARYQDARSTWAEAAALAAGPYKADLTFGPEPFLRGHWTDRLAAIDEDIRALAALLRQAEVGATPPGRWPTPPAALQAQLDERRPEQPLRHDQPPSFTPGQPLAILVTAATGLAAPAQVELHYRHVNQAERYTVAAMTHATTDADAVCYGATIPGAYTETRFPLQYFFALRDARGRAWRWPGLGPLLTAQPYFVVRALAATATGGAISSSTQPGQRGAHSDQVVG